VERKVKCTICLRESEDEYFVPGTLTLSGERVVWCPECAEKEVEEDGFWSSLKQEEENFR